MKAENIILLLFLATIFLFVGSECNAQNPPAPKKDPDAVLIKQVGSTGAFHFNREDLFKGSAFFYALGSVDDVYHEKDTLTITLSFQVLGKELIKPEILSLSITSKSRDTKYTNNHKLRLFADGKEIVNAETEITRPRREGSAYGTEVFELKSIRFKDFEKFAKAKNLSVEFGATRIMLGAEQQKRVQEFYQLFKD